MATFAFPVGLDMAGTLCMTSHNQRTRHLSYDGVFYEQLGQLREQKYRRGYTMYRLNFERFYRRSGHT